jgi:hypothetical protein
LTASAVVATAADGRRSMSRCARRGHSAIVIIGDVDAAIVIIVLKHKRASSL